MKKVTHCFRDPPAGWLCLFVFLVSCAVNPVTGKKQVVLMSEQQEIAMGAQSDPQVVAEYGLYENEALQQFIDAHGQEMARISHRPGLKFQFRILDSPVVNAFAVPGGYVYFTRGIMAHFNDEAQFAGVLGHEIGHITARHGVEQYTNQAITQVLFAGGLILSKELRAFSNEAQTAIGLLFLQNSRANESQSDELGVEYSTKVGYDASHMADFFRTLKAINDEDGGSLPTFLSSHPDPADRYDRVKKLAADAKLKYPQAEYKVNHDSYLDMIDGIIFGEDPRQGFVENSVFYHPELKFQFPIPTGWAVSNSPSQVAIAPENGKALIQFSIAQGNDLETAANNESAKLKLTVSGSRRITISGLNALEVNSVLTSQDPSTGQVSQIVLKSVYVLYSGNVYVFHGVSTPQDFSAYLPLMEKTMFGFAQMKDQAKLNAQPDRIRVVGVPQAGTLEQALTTLQVPAARQKEVAILNGLELRDQVTRGLKIKILRK